MRITVDLNRCQGYAQCVPLAPDVLKLLGEEALAYDPDPRRFAAPTSIARGGVVPGTGDRGLPELYGGRRDDIHRTGPRSADGQGRDVGVRVARAVCEHRVGSPPACRQKRASSDHIDPNAGRVPGYLELSHSNAGVAEWLGTGLQSRRRGFESRHSLASGLVTARRRERPCSRLLYLLELKRRMSFQIFRSESIAKFDLAQRSDVLKAPLGSRRRPRSSAPRPGHHPGGESQIGNKRIERLLPVFGRPAQHRRRVRGGHQCGVDVEVCCCVDVR